MPNCVGSLFVLCVKQRRPAAVEVPGVEPGYPSQDGLKEPSCSGQTHHPHRGPFYVLPRTVGGGRRSLKVVGHNLRIPDGVHIKEVLTRSDGLQKIHLGILRIFHVLRNWREAETPLHWRPILPGRGPHCGYLNSGTPPTGDILGYSYDSQYWPIHSVPLSAPCKQRSRDGNVPSPSLSKSYPSSRLTPRWC